MEWTINVKSNRMFVQNVSRNFTTKNGYLKIMPPGRIDPRLTEAWLGLFSPIVIITTRSFKLPLVLQICISKYLMRTSMLFCIHSHVSRSKNSKFLLCYKPRYMKVRAINHRYQQSPLQLNTNIPSSIPEGSKIF